MKILSTQINGLLQRLAGQEEIVEETARLLAQAAVGEGKVIIAGFDEMKAVGLTAVHGEEPMQDTVLYTSNEEITSADRVWILTRSSKNVHALQLARYLASHFFTFAVLTSGPEDSDNELASLADVYMSTTVVKGLLPGEEGERIVKPHALAGLFLYEAVKMEYDEMLRDE